MNVSLREAWDAMLSMDDILLLTHRLPDGDAVGSLFALCGVLRSMGKRVTYEIDAIPRDLMFLTALPQADVVPRYVITVDVGDKKLLGDALAAKWGDQVALAIDHHATHAAFAEKTFVDPSAAAAAEVLFDLFTFGGVRIDRDTATWLYAGVSTDTGCFRYGNTTAKTMRTAASLMDLGIDTEKINTDLFETKTRAYVRFEAAAMDNLRFYLDGRCAVTVLTQETYRRCGVTENDTKTVNALPRQIEGVLAGVTVKEKNEGGWRVSVRTRQPVRATEICAAFGGGGHQLAAGCELTGEIDEVVARIVGAAEREINRTIN